MNGDLTTDNTESEDDRYRREKTEEFQHRLKLVRQTRAEEELSRREEAEKDRLNLEAYQKACKFGIVGELGRYPGFPGWSGADVEKNFFIQPFHVRASEYDIVFSIEMLQAIASFVDMYKFDGTNLGLNLHLKINETIKGLKLVHSLNLWNKKVPILPIINIYDMGKK